MNRYRVGWQRNVEVIVTAADEKSAANLAFEALSENDPAAAIDAAWDETTECTDELLWCSLAETEKTDE